MGAKRTITFDFCRFYEVKSIVWHAILRGTDLDGDGSLCIVMIYLGWPIQQRFGL